jgi:hypothetical protein
VQDGNQRAAKDKQDEAEQALVRSYVGESSAARCRRVVLDGYLDRREAERLGCEEGEERCDVCRGEETDEADEAEEEGSEEPSDGEEMAAEMDRESEREETQRAFEQQQRERQGPRQTLT